MIYFTLKFEADKHLFKAMTKFKTSLHNVMVHNH